MKNPQAILHTLLPIRKFDIKLQVIQLDEDGKDEKVVGVIKAVDCGKTADQAMRKVEKKFRIRAVSAERQRKKK